MFKRMINERLVWYLEHNNIQTNIQSGFRNYRTTQDQRVVSIFFDMEKAYDTA